MNELKIQLPRPLPRRARHSAAARREAALGAQAKAGGGGEVTVASLLQELEEARKIAVAKKQPTPAIAAILAKARIAGIGDETPEARAAPAPSGPPDYADAARRIAYVLRHGSEPAPDESQR